MGHGRRRGECSVCVALGGKAYKAPTFEAGYPTFKVRVEVFVLFYYSLFDIIDDPTLLSALCCSFSGPSVATVDRRRKEGSCHLQNQTTCKTLRALFSILTRVYLPNRVRALSARLSAW